MLKLLSLAATILAAGVLTGSAIAQQSANTQSAPAAGAPAMQSQAAPDASSASIPGLPTEKDKISYAIGMNIGKGMSRDGLDVDPDILMKGLKAALAGSPTLMTDEQAQAAMTQLRTQMMTKMQAKQKAEADTNQKAGEAYLAANKSKPGVVALPDGLQYKIITAGTGPKPTATDMVSCKYRGTLIDGKEFDSTQAHGGQPLQFQVNGVIKGWTEALQLMPVGSKWQLFIPASLAYGERGAPPDIGPNATLIFDVELLSIDKKPEAGAEPSSK